MVWFTSVPFFGRHEMIATLPQQGTSSRSRIVEPPSVHQQPPSERDFELYLALVAECITTRAAAERFGISQTRVQQVRQRVAEWLGPLPMPSERLSPRQRVMLAGETGKQRIDFLTAQANEAWHASKGTTTRI